MKYIVKNKIALLSVLVCLPFIASCSGEASNDGKSASNNTSSTDGSSANQGGSTDNGGSTSQSGSSGNSTSTNEAGSSGSGSSSNQNSVENSCKIGEEIYRQNSKQFYGFENAAPDYFKKVAEGTVKLSDTSLYRNGVYINGDRAKDRISCFSVSDNSVYVYANKARLDNFKQRSFPQEYLDKIKNKQPTSVVKLSSAKTIGNVNKFVAEHLLFFAKKPALWSDLALTDVGKTKSIKINKFIRLKETIYARDPSNNVVNDALYTLINTEISFKVINLNNSGVVALETVGEKTFVNSTFKYALPEVLRSDIFLPIEVDNQKYLVSDDIFGKKVRSFYKGILAVGDENSVWPDNNVPANGIPSDRLPFDISKLNP